MMKWLIVLALCLGILAGCSPVGPDPQFDNESQMRDYFAGAVAKLQHSYKQEISKLRMACEKGEITHEEYLEMSAKILEKYSIKIQKLQDKYLEEI